MYLLFICFMLSQSDAANDAPEVNFKFFKNVTTNYSQLNEIHEAVLNFRPIIFKRNNNDKESINYEQYDNITDQAINTKIYNRLKYKYQAMLQKYEAHAIKKGSESLRDIPYYMLVELHIRTDALPPTDNFIMNFTKKARAFFKELYKQKFVTDIDKELSLLDTVQMFNSFVYSEQLTLLNDYIFVHNLNVTTDTLMVILKHFYNEFIDNKRADTEYLCVKFEICRPTLRFTDYIGDIFREFLKLSDAKLTDILLKLSLYLKYQSEFFQLILGKSSALEIGNKLEDLVFRDISGMRNIFVGLRTYLARRHRFIQNPDNEINTRNKALRILLDIIDQSFEVNGDEILSMHFNFIIKTIADWAVGYKNEIEKVLKSFVNHAVGVMKMNLSNDAVKEIKALVDILMKKEDKNNKVYRYLLRHGSTFVRGEDVSFKISLLT